MKRWLKLNLRELAIENRKAEGFRSEMLWNSTTTGLATMIPLMTVQRGVQLSVSSYFAHGISLAFPVLCKCDLAVQLWKAGLFLFLVFKRRLKRKIW